MPDILQDLFWSKHGDTMEMLGYARGGEILTPIVSCVMFY
jgi:hypothetical protein